MSEPPSRQVVIDDSDNQVQYTGSGWVRDLTGSQDGFGTYGAPYKHTLHATHANDSLAFSFNGSTIRVYGTIDLSPTYGLNTVNSADFRPPWECFIDNASIGSSKPSPFHENNWLLCESDHLSDGPHELTLNISMRQGTTFWIDYLLYTPSKNTTENAVVLVENTDPALSYDSSWRDVGGLATMTSTNGAQVKFGFTGTQLIWMGYIPIELPGNGSSASYSIDDGPSTSFSLVGHLPTDGTSTFNQIFFTTPQLAAGSHSMVVTYNGNSQLTPLTLDYIYLTTSSLGNGTAPGSPSGAPQSGGSKHTPVGPIVGGIIGGLAAIAIVLALIFYWRRRRGRPVSSAISTTTASTWFAGPRGNAFSSENRNEAVSPFSPTYQPSHSELSSAALTSVPPLVRGPGDSHSSGATTTDNMSLQQSVTNPRGGDYASGAMAQIGDAKRGHGGRTRVHLAVNALPHPASGRIQQPTQGGIVLFEEVPPRYSA